MICLGQCDRNNQSQVRTNIPYQDPPEDVCMATNTLPHTTTWRSPQVWVRFRRICPSSGIIVHLASQVQRHIIFQPRLRFTFKPYRLQRLIYAMASARNNPCSCYVSVVCVYFSFSALTAGTQESQKHGESWKHDALYSYLVHSQGVH